MEIKFYTLTDWQCHFYVIGRNVVFNVLSEMVWTLREPLFLEGDYIL